MDLVWESRGLVKATYRDRQVDVGGEALLDGKPDFLIFAQYLQTWSDGTPLTDEDKTGFLDDLVEAARQRGWTFEIAW